MSNSHDNSDDNETVTSEMPSLQQQQSGRLLPKPRPDVRPQQGSKQGGPPLAEPETLMMAYAQTVGSFTLDGSLVNTAPFEEVKRRCAQTSGGVVGLDHSSRSSQRNSGMFGNTALGNAFGGFGWGTIGNIGESLNNLLGSDDMSSMAQMKATASSKEIPLLSTPQSLLFVDLTLAPGECRSYSYRFQLPRGLPPSHRGRAMKVNYHLSIGVQRPGSDSQAVRRLEIPFRVLGSYNSRGEALGHDLWSPYILLQDAARTQSITAHNTDSGSLAFLSQSKEKKTKKPGKQGLEDFLRYTERLLEQPKDGTAALLSPTSPSDASMPPLSPAISRQDSLTEHAPTNIKEAIDFAVLRSNRVNNSASNAKKKAKETAQSANRFTIARSGQPVAVLILLRPAYRLGETVVGMLDFTAPSTSPSNNNASSSSSTPQSKTYAVTIDLESVEKVDPSLALRSESSVRRVTRKVHACVHENTLFARRTSFSLPIPASATATFETTGVAVNWGLRVGFVVQRQLQQPQQVGLQVPSAMGGVGERPDEEVLLEELGSDERGTTLIARERLAAEGFEVLVPVKIFGAPAVGGGAAAGEGNGNGEGVEGLEV
jgi:RAB6A-GEF complex partner protein 2